MKRPELHDKEVITVVAKKLAPELMEWGVRDNLAETAEELERILTDYTWDAFELAKEVENAYCCGGDVNLVDVMKNADHLGYRELKARIKEWVKENDIKPEFKVGDMVSFQRRCEKMVGKITDIKTDTAEYIVNYNEASGYTSFGGAVLAYEDVKGLG